MRPGEGVCHPIKAPPLPRGVGGFHTTSEAMMFYQLPLWSCVCFELFNYLITPEHPIVTNNLFTLIISFGIIPE